MESQVTLRFGIGAASTHTEEHFEDRGLLGGHHPSRGVRGGRSGQDYLCRAESNGSGKASWNLCAGLCRASSVCLGGGGGMREERHPNRLHGIQRQAVAWWLEERDKLEQPVCKIQGRTRAEVGSMPGQRVWRCEPGPDHSGSVFSMRRLDFSFYGKESH